MNDILQVRNPQPIKLSALRTALINQLVRCGFDKLNILSPQSAKRIRKPISLSNGFRKHVISTFIQAGLNHEIRELIVDHATHLDANYFRPTEDQVLEEYLKAEPYLTIDPTNRLKQENQILRIRADKVDGALQEIAELKKSIGLQ